MGCVIVCVLRAECLIGFFDGLFFELLHLIQDLLDDDFADAVAAQARKQGSAQDGQVAQQQIIDGRTDVGDDDACAGGTQVILWTV